MSYANRRPVKRVQTTWRPAVITGTPGAIASLGVNVGALLPAITNASDASTKLSGKITGGTIDIALDTKTAGAGDFIEYALLLLPPGIADPAAWIDSTKATYENFVWYTGLMDVHPSNDAKALLRLKLATERRFSKGTALKLLFKNQYTAAWGAASYFCILTDLYIEED